MLAAAAAAVFWLPRDVNHDLKLADIATAVLTFATISFGACLTGAVLALTIPSDTQRHELSAQRAEARFTDFSDLVFTFTWSAMSQLPLVLLAFATYGIGGTVHATHDLGSHVPERVVLGTMAFVGVNAFLQLTTVVKTISQLAQVGPLLEAAHARRRDQGASPN